MLITDLPLELLASLPDYLDSLDDWYALIRSSRSFRNTCSTTKAVFPPVFAKKGGQELFPPHPHLLLSGIARQIADWAVQSEVNTCVVKESLARGHEGLLKLGEEVARIGVQDVRALHKAKIEVIGPLAKIIDVGGRPCSLNPTHEDTSEDYTSTLLHDIWAEPAMEMYNFIIRCELLHVTVDSSFTSLPTEEKPFGIDLRYEWIRCRVPERERNAMLGEVGPKAQHEWKVLTVTERTWSIVPSEVPCNVHAAEDPHKQRRYSSRYGMEWRKRSSTDEKLVVRLFEHQGMGHLLANGVEPEFSKVGPGDGVCKWIQDIKEASSLRKLWMDSEPEYYENDRLRCWFSMLMETHDFIWT